MQSRWFAGLLVASALFACNQEKPKPAGDAAKPATPPANPATPPANPPATPPANPPAEEKPSEEAVAHLMARFNAALVQKPTNKNPATDWAVLVNDPAASIMCADCHKPEDVQAFAATALDKRPADMERWEKDIPYMKKVMANWMKKANNNPGTRAKLKAELTCKSCHASIAE